MTCDAADSLPAGGKRKRVQTKLFGDDFVRDDLKPGRGPRRRKVGLPAQPKTQTLVETLDADELSILHGDLARNYATSNPK